MVLFDAPCHLDAEHWEARAGALMGVVEMVVVVVVPREVILMAAAAEVGAGVGAAVPREVEAAAAPWEVAVAVAAVVPRGIGLMTTKFDLPLYPMSLSFDLPPSGFADFYSEALSAG
jgi:hypothetical protein